MTEYKLIELLLSINNKSNQQVKTHTTNMKAVQILGSAESHTVSLTNDMAPPTPSSTEVIVKIKAAGITADEVSWPELYETEAQIPGHDISGVVESLGPGYDGALAVGDEVFGMIAASARQGGQAEYAPILASELSIKPKNISHETAAALPIPVLTAWEGLFTHAKLAKGAKVFVTGASGAVGSMVVQMASKISEAHVIGLASRAKQEEVISLGAKQCIDYADPEWHQKVKDVDLVFDTVGGETLDKCWQTLKQDGHLVTIGDPIPSWAFGQGEPKELAIYPNVKWTFFIVSPDAKMLSHIGGLIEEGLLTPLAIKTFGVDDATTAWEHAAKRGRKGKVVIRF